MSAVTQQTGFVDLRALLGRDPQRFDTLFGAFVALYDDAFPDPEEREDPQEWRARLRDSPPPPQPYMQLLLAVERTADGAEAVLGGIAYEYYRDSACGLLTYVAVDPRRRGNGIARKLLARAHADLRSIATAQEKTLRAAFGEAQIPALLDDPAQREFAHRRQLMLGKLGAMRLDTPYVQPELSGGGGRSRHLMLMLMTDGETPAHLAAETVRAFLHEFYRALGVPHPEVDADFQASVAALALGVRMIPIIEAPALAATNIAMCLHFVQRSGGRPFSPAQDSDCCPIFHSMELDLLSSSFQAPPPFETVSLTHGDVPDDACVGRDYGFPLRVRFPDHVTYRSEGRTETRYCVHPVRKLRAYIARTRFFGSNVTIWHVVLRPDAGETLTEFDLIKLIHLYDGRTEETTLATDVRFSGSSDSEVDVRGLPGMLVPDHVRHKLQPVGGTCQWIALEPCEGADEASAALARRALAHARDLPTLSAWVERNTTEGRWVKALCGVLTGIFDFDEIDGNEAMDTLAPTVDLPGCLIQMHRRTLLQISDHDRPMASCRGTVGISPYLLVPHAAVLFNEQLLEQADETAKTALRLSAPPISALQAAHDLVDKNVRRLWLPNIFNYATERALFEKGLQGRGAMDRFWAVERRMQELKSCLGTAWERRRDIGQAVIAALVAVLAVLQVQEPVFKMIDPREPMDVKWIMLGLIAAIVAAATIWFRLRGIQRRNDAAGVRLDPLDD